MYRTRLSLFILTALLPATLPAATVDLRIMETTDLHSNMVDYDYYQDKPTEKFGLVRTASLIRQAREQAKNSVLVDNGDVIQGSPLADYVVATGLSKTTPHPVYLAMNTLDYSVGNLGNHEFNYGLEFLQRALAGARFPYVNANIIDTKTGQPLFRPWLMQKKTVTDRQGKSHTLNIAYIGFVPPQITIWDKRNLAGKVTVEDITETARKWVPVMRKAGADLVVAVPHSGLSAEPYKALAENSVYYLSQVPGIDVILFGHAHAVFPSQDFAGIDGVDIQQGTIHGIPAVMPGFWGSHLGVVDLVLNNDQGAWRVTQAKAQARPIYDNATHTAQVSGDDALRQVLKDIHQHTRDFVNQPVGSTDDEMASYLALVQDDPTLEIVNQAQIAYTRRFIQGDPDLADLPVLAAAAPFRAGGRKNDPTGYIVVNKGEMTFRNIADLYTYPNTLAVVKVNGKELKEWLECAAGMFNQIDPQRTEPQALLNWAGFRTYNFDVIDGVNYQIDVTQPARYDGECQLIHPDAQRIQQLTWQGKPIDPNAQFLIATNNYRAYGGKFAGTGDAHIAFASPDENRQVLTDYARQLTQKQGGIHPHADQNWRLAPIHSPVKLDIRFETAPGEAAARFIRNHARYPITFKAMDNAGFAVYQIDLQADAQ